MKRIEVTGKTVEDALAAGLKQLGCTISDVTWVTLEEGAKGLFGLFGSRPAKVQLTLQDEEEEDALSSELLASLTLDSTPVKKDKPEVKEAPKAEVQAAAPAKAPDPKPVQEFRAPKAEAAEAAPEKAPAARPAARSMGKPAPKPMVRPKPQAPAKPIEPIVKREPLPEPTEPPIQHPADTTLGKAQQFLKEVTTLMGVDVQVYVEEEADKHLYARMHGDTLGVLIGRRGETLDALQYLTSLVVNRKQEDYIRVTLDTENYRAKREEALRRLAMRMANRVVKTGRRVVMEPMNPYERRILHATLQGYPGVVTHSEGEEPNRHIIISVKRPERGGN